MKLDRVKKRDGREVPFDESKIAAAIEKAMRAVGEDDPTFATEVATLVRMALGERLAADGAPRAPEIEEIQDLVEKALIELGRAAVAKAYILYRDRRARARGALEVRTGGPRGPSSVRVIESRGAAPWSKGRIVAALMREADLSRESSEKVADKVESRVFDAGLRELSTALVRELVDNELVGLGLDAALRKQVSIGLPLYDLRRLFETPEKDPDPLAPAPAEDFAWDAPERAVASDVLCRYASSELLPSAAAALHAAGDLDVLGLERPHRALWIAIPAELVAAGAPAVTTGFDALEEIARQLRDCSHGVVVQGPARLVPANPSVLGPWVRSLAALAQAARRRVDLGPGVLPGVRPGGRSAPFLERLIEELVQLPPTAFAPRLFVDEAELEDLLVAGGNAAFDELVTSGRLVATWTRPGHSFAAPGCLRRRGERGALACGGVVALNLPRLALRAGPWREERLLEALAELAGPAVDALDALRQVQERARAVRGGPRRRTEFAIAPVGLRECLRWLGDGEIRPGQGARLVGFLGEVVREIAERRRMSVSLSPLFGTRAAARFAALDAELPQHAQRLLFREGVGSGLQPGVPYTVGYGLAPVPGYLPLAAEAELAATLASGAVPVPPTGERAGQLGDVLPTWSESWHRFRADRDGRSAPAGEPTPVPADPSLFSAS